MATYSVEKKAEVLAAVMAGMAIIRASREFGVGRSTIKAWRREAGHTPALVSQEKKADLGVLIAEYLRAGLEALKAQAIVFSDPDWIKKQPAGEIAILHGVVADKLSRVLTALESLEAPENG